MYEITCLDSQGNSINNFTQWDVNQRIRIIVEGCDSKMFVNPKPQVHFANVKSKYALVVAGDSNVEVTTTSTENDTITVDVPNELLQEAYPLIVYVYFEDSEDGDYAHNPDGTVKRSNPQSTVLQTEIPVRKRVRPSDYMYVENIERITANTIKMEVEEETKLVRDAAEQYINDTRDAAKTYINNVRDEAKSYIDTQKADFIATGEQIIADANKIKSDTNGIKTATNTIYNNTVTVYNNTVAVADQTKAEIENDMRTMMLENGMSLVSTNDGKGNVTTTFIINEE